jgi:hypothetical protein
MLYIRLISLSVDAVLDFNKRGLLSALMLEGLCSLSIPDPR